MQRRRKYHVLGDGHGHGLESLLEVVKLEGFVFQQINEPQHENNIWSIETIICQTYGMIGCQIRDCISSY